jgi:hypothetical protein
MRLSTLLLPAAFAANVIHHRHRSCCRCHRVTTTATATTATATTVVKLIVIHCEERGNSSITTSVPMAAPM